MYFYLFIIISFFAGIFLTIRFFGTLLDFITEHSNGRGVKNGPWRTHLGVGRKNIPRIEKAAIACIGLGANNSDETIYWNAFTDTEGRALFSGNTYRLRFRRHPLVDFKANGFWSITVYGQDKFLVPNDAFRYEYNSHHCFRTSDTGEFAILLSRSDPADGSEWLPLPLNDEKFSLALRCYVPKEDMKKNAGQNTLPDIMQL